MTTEFTHPTLTNIPGKPGRPAAEDSSSQDPLAYYVPTLVTFENRRTSLPRAQQQAIEGTVGWHAEVFTDGEAVTDKHGVTHTAIPLGRLLTAEDIAPINRKLITIAHGNCDCEVQSRQIERHNPKCHYRLAEEIAGLLADLVKRSNSTHPESPDVATPPSPTAG